MKKIILLSAICISTITLNAQLKISTSNKVGINNENPQSLLSVNTDGYSDYTASIQSTGNNRTLRVLLDAPTNSNYNLALVAGISNYSSGLKNVAGFFNAYQSSSTHSKRTFGIRSTAGNGANGYNYGVLGILYGTRNGAGIVGSIESEPYIVGRYAGYFEGNVKVTDNMYVESNLYVSGVQVTSDIRLKNNVSTLRSVVGEQENLNRLLQLTPITYTLSKPEINLPKEVTDTLSVNSIDTKNISLEDEKKHIGLSAQELELIYPELVSESNNGYKSINYIGLIPVLIEGMREQQEAIEKLQAEVETLKAAGTK